MAASVLVTLVAGATRLENIEVEPTATIASLQKAYRDVLTFPANPSVTANGQPVDGTYRVRNGDVILWTKPTGQKG